MLDDWSAPEVRTRGEGAAEGVPADVVGDLVWMVFIWFQGVAESYPPPFSSPHSSLP
jgi:hypothetical protein